MPQKLKKTTKQSNIRATEKVLPRLPIIDLARGIALIVMAIFHFSWDLMWYDFVTWQVTEATSWLLFRTAIASSFLFLTGVSLTLAHRNGINFQPFVRRFLIIFLCAVAITLATWYMFSDQLVRFGILHFIAFSSIVGLIFLRLPKLVIFLSASFFAFLPLFVQISYLDLPNLTWIGLGTTKPDTVDYVPVFPWLAAPLYGMVITKFALEKDWHLKLANLQLENQLFKPILLFGRHSLLFYMVHQPILIGLILLAIAAGIGKNTIAEVEFHGACLIDCHEAKTDRSNCRNICFCLIEQLQHENNWEQVVVDPKKPQNLTLIRKSYQECDQMY